MPRMKRKSRVVEYAEQRMATIQTIVSGSQSAVSASKEDLDINALQNAIAEVRATLNKYNAALSTVDQLSEELTAQERSLVVRNDRILSAINVKFGRDSVEYRQVRSVRLYNSKRRTTPSPEAVPASV
jgi:hypothetical protein